MSKIPLLFLVMLLLHACYNENKIDKTPPANLLTEEQLIEILTDIQLTEAIISESRLGRTIASNQFKDSIYDLVFDHYQISVEMLDSNLAYYNTDPEHMEKIYESVLSRLSQHETEIRVEANESEKKKEEGSKK